MAPKSTFGRLRTFGRGNSVPINTANLNLNETHIATAKSITSTHAANTSPTGGIAEGGSYVFHTDGKSLKSASATVSSSSSSGKVVSLPAHQLRPSHWATSRSPGMRMESTSTLSQSVWTSLFTEPQESSDKSVRSKNIMFIVLCVLYMLVCGGIGYLIRGQQ